MARGGKRKGAGVSSSWKNTPTSTIRVPEVLKSQLLEIARSLDQQIEKNSLQSSTDLIAFHNANCSFPISLAMQSFQLTISSYDEDFPSLSEAEFQDMVRKSGIESLYYITHVQNIESILTRGILSHRP